MTGIAGTESDWMQFGRKGGSEAPFTLFGKIGQWPTESYDCGSHIGLMQMPTNMTDGYDWSQNALDGVNLFAALRRNSMGPAF